MYTVKVPEKYCSLTVTRMSSPEPKSRVRISNNPKSNNADHGEIFVQNYNCHIKTNF
jgi:hypothetical protein